MMYSLKNVAIVAASVALVNPVSAFWRLECHGVAGRAMIDPLVDPGEMSGHLHTIKGASGLTMSSSADDLLKSDCTSCQVKQDKSAYWSTQLYFMHDDGTFEMVPEDGGHLTYYKYVPAFVNGQLKNPVAIPNGMKIVSGTTTRRSFDYAVPDPPRPWTGKDASQDALQQKAIGFNCMNYAKPGEDSLYRHTLPSKEFLDANCPDGLRLEVLFPICWNGKDLDSKDHKSHLAYSDAGLNGGNCPEGYDTIINQLFFETIYPVQNYAGKSGKFVLSNGDATGNGNHGDVLIAWDEGVLKAATEQCGPVVAGQPGFTGVTSECPVFDMVPVDDQAQCKIQVPEVQVKMNFAANAKALPGNNPITFGPGPANAPAPAPASPAPADNNPVPDPSSSVGNALPNPAGNVLLQATNKPADSKAEAPAPVPAPAPTPAPVANPAPLNAGEKVLSTSTYTKDGAVYEVVIVQDIVTVTAEPTPAAVKRHAHVHQHLGRRSHIHHPRRR